MIELTKEGTSVEVVTSVLLRSIFVVSCIAIYQAISEKSCLFFFSSWSECIGSYTRRSLRFDKNE